MSCMGETMKWKETREGRMSIYYLALYVTDSLRENAYLDNSDAHINDADKIIEFLRTLLITEWIGD